MQKKKSIELNNKLKKFILIPIITSSILWSCNSIQTKKEMKIHNIKNAISFVRNDNDKKMLTNSILLMNIHGDNVHYFKEYSQITPKNLKFKRKIKVYDVLNFITRATQDNFIYVSDENNQIKAYVTLYNEKIHDSSYEYYSNESISFLSTSIGELMIKVYSNEVENQIKFFYNKIISESVISFLYSTKHLTKQESENIINEIWNY